jgi:hypothetical protein
MNKPANDNALTGKAARAWRAMTRATAGTLFPGDPPRNARAAIALEAFALLYEEASKPANALPCSLGSLSTVADLGDDFGRGFGPERYYDLPNSCDDLAGLCIDIEAWEAAGRPAEEPAATEGMVRVLMRAAADYPLERFKGGRWCRIDEERWRGRAVSDRAAAAVAGAYASQPSALDRVLIKRQLERFRASLGEDKWQGLVALAVGRATARDLGEAHGKTHKRAEAFGGDLMRQYIEAAIALLRANDNEAEYPKSALAG